MDAGQQPGSSHHNPHDGGAGGHFRGLQFTLAHVLVLLAFVLFASSSADSVGRPSLLSLKKS